MAFPLLAPYYPSFNSISQAMNKTNTDGNASIRMIVSCDFFISIFLSFFLSLLSGRFLFYPRNCCCFTLYLCLVWFGLVWHGVEMYFDFVEMQIKDNKRSTQKLCTLSTQNGIVWLLLAVTSVLEFVNRIENSINVELESERGGGEKALHKTKQST